MSDSASPANQKDSVARTFLVAFGVCLVCAIFVCAAAVQLKSVQLVNQELDRQVNILKAAGLVDAAASPDKDAVMAMFERIDTKYVDLDSGEYVEAPVEPYNMMKLAKDPEFSMVLEPDADQAKIKRRINVAQIYIAKDEQGEVESVILPVNGYGLWSTLYGFLALSADGSEVVGLGFYQHAETPGLGGEVDNPKWKSLWPGKQVFNEDGDVALSVIKGAVDPSSRYKEYQVDGLAGATLTTRGVDNLIQFWLGDMGFGPFLDNLRG